MSDELMPYQDDETMTEAEKEATKRLREEMAEFREEVSEIDTKANDALIDSVRFTKPK